jgi:hypothetical protein
MRALPYTNWPHIIMWILKVHFVCVFVIVTWWFCKNLLKYGTCCNGMHVSPCPSNAIWIYQITHLREILEGSRIPTSPLNYIKGIVELVPLWSVVLGKVMYAPCGVICECHSLCVWSVAFWATAVVHEIHCGHMIQGLYNPKFWWQWFYSFFLVGKSNINTLA